jgi:hypothetical protein
MKDVQMISEFSNAIQKSKNARPYLILREQDYRTGTASKSASFESWLASWTITML